MAAMLFHQAAISNVSFGQRPMDIAVSDKTWKDKPNFLANYESMCPYLSGLLGEAISSKRLLSSTWENNNTPVPWHTIDWRWWPYLSCLPELLVRGSFSWVHSGSKLAVPSCRPAQPGLPAGRVGGTHVGEYDWGRSSLERPQVELWADEGETSWQALLWSVQGRTNQVLSLLWPWALHLFLAFWGQVGSWEAFGRWETLASPPPALTLPGWLDTSRQPPKHCQSGI